MRSVLPWMAMLAVVPCSACSDASTPPEEPIPFNPQERGNADAGTDAGCVADLTRDPAHCGRCDIACSAGANQKATCQSGVCQATCEPGWGDCDGDPSNGCELSLASDAANCGACGRSCGLCGAAACSQGSCTPTVVVTGQTGAYDVTLDATRVYWSTRVASGAVRRALKDGTSVETVVNASLPTDILVSGYYLYYTRPAAAGSGEGVNRISLPGVVGPFPQFVTGQDFPGGMVADETGIYWTRNRSLQGAIVRCFGCNGAGLDLVDNLPAAGRLSVDPKSIVAVLGDAVVTFDKTGQNRKTLTIGQQDVTGVASSETDVFVAKRSAAGSAGAPGEVLRMPKSGEAITPIVSQIAPASLRLLDGHLYFAVTSPDKTLRRIDPNGSTAVTLAKDLTSPGAVAVDATCAYFTDGDRILKVTK